MLRSKTFDHHLTQGFFITEALDHIQNFYTGQPTHSVVISGNPFGQMFGCQRDEKRPQFLRVVEFSVPFPIVVGVS